MILGIIGRGPWGNVYRRTLTEMEIDHWQAGKDWKEQPTPDGAIVASSGESHYSVAQDLMARHVPVIVEKPLCMSTDDAYKLLELAEKTQAIAFAGHTRVYSPEWLRFKEELKDVEVKSIYAQAGGPCKLDPTWDWMPHILSMCVDLGARPDVMTVRLFAERVPFRFTVNGEHTFSDRMTNPRPLTALVQKFVQAIEKGKPNWTSLALGVKVVELIDV